MVCQNLSGRFDIFIRHPTFRSAFPGAKHTATTKQLNLIITRTTFCANRRSQQSFDSVIRIANIGSFNRISLSGQHNMAHATDLSDGMPHGDRHAGSQDGTNTNRCITEIQISRMQKYIDLSSRAFHLFNWTLSCDKSMASPRRGHR